MNRYLELKKIVKEKELVIFGAGIIGKNLYDLCSEFIAVPSFFLDNDSAKDGKDYLGKKVYLPREEIIKNEKLLFVLANRCASEIEEQLLTMNVSSSKIYFYDEILEGIWVEKGKKEQIIYYPIFDDSTQLTSHYYRACWYLPKENNLLENVFLYAKRECKLFDKPDYMGDSNVPCEHIVVKEDSCDYEEALEKCKVILTWKHISDEEKQKLELTGSIVVNVDTEDEDAKEYGRYCSLIWSYFKLMKEKKDIIRKSYNRFCDVAKKIKEENLQAGCVFGTGPSLESSYEFDFSSCLCVVCNSIVQNREMLAHINPFFVTAGDAVSHLGVSLYAEKFRNDLQSYLLDSKAYFLTTAPLGYILSEQCPAIESKIILVEQRLDRQNYNMLENFALPKFDSTLNIHMLPIIHTFCDNIYINGCDGKCPDVNNEDFWAHAGTAQYLELVDTGHKCHPTFDRNRKKSTYARYQDSTQISIECGEREHGKIYRTLKQSYIEALKDKKMADDGAGQYNKKGQLIIGK